MSTALYSARSVLWMPLEIDWSPPSTEARFCCGDMSSALDFFCAQHADPFECADALVVYNEIFDEYGLVIHDGGASYLLLSYCPFCGTKLPDSARDRWFDETEALGLEGDDLLPRAFRTGAWRRA